MTGIIVARFQTSYLHEGHLRVIRYVLERSERVILFLGTTATRLTFTNPISFESRMLMVNSQFHNVEVYPLPDHKYDEVWSNNLDSKIEELCKGDDVTLFGDRDSFIESYNGKFKKEFTDVTIPTISATTIRRGHHMCPLFSKEWLAGVIWASEYKYPVSYQVVDIAIINSDTNKILLGKKEGETKYRFVGGFVDATDESLELAAKREVGEECGNIETDNYNYIGSFRIDDWRYRKERDKIMTAFFCANYIFGRVVPSDDIEHLQWLNLEGLTENDFEPEHVILFNSLMNYLKSIKHETIR